MNRATVLFVLLECKTITSWCLVCDLFMTFDIFSVVKFVVLQKIGIVSVESRSRENVEFQVLQATQAGNTTPIFNQTEAGNTTITQNNHRKIIVKKRGGKNHLPNLFVMYLQMKMKKQCMKEHKGIRLVVSILMSYTQESFFLTFLLGTFVKKLVTGCTM